MQGRSVGYSFKPIPAPIGLKDCIDLNEKLMVVGCVDGLIRMFDPAVEEALVVGKHPRNPIAMRFPGIDL